jgi:hypothetical protein
MPLLTKDKEAREREAAARARRDREKSEVDAGRREFERLKEKVRADLKAKDEARAAEVAEVERMSPVQLIARERQRETQPPQRTPSLPRGWVIAREAVEAEDRERAQEQRRQVERDAGLTKRQAKFDAAEQAIKDARAAAVREAGERCRADEQAAREREQQELNALGERPTLAASEAEL